MVFHVKATDGRVCETLTESGAVTRRLLRAGTRSRRTSPEAQPGDVPAPSAEDIYRVERTMKGSAGPDGWTGAEIRHLPLACLTHFHALADNGRGMVGFLISSRKPG